MQNAPWRMKPFERLVRKANRDLKFLVRHCAPDAVIVLSLLERKELRKYELSHTRIRSKDAMYR